MRLILEAEIELIHGQGWLQQIIIHGQDILLHQTNTNTRHTYTYLTHGSREMGCSERWDDFTAQAERCSETRYTYTYLIADFTTNQPLHPSHFTPPLSLSLSLSLSPEYYATLSVLRHHSISLNPFCKFVVTLFGFSSNHSWYIYDFDLVALQELCTLRRQEQDLISWVVYVGMFLTFSKFHLFVVRKNSFCVAEIQQSQKLL